MASEVAEARRRGALGGLPADPAVGHLDLVKGNRHGRQVVYELYDHLAGLIGEAVGHVGPVPAAAEGQPSDPARRRRILPATVSR
jgi:hypothetical protein